jgi:Carboxypeptidase regulatory-like domain/TonB dependent receptor
VLRPILFDPGDFVSNRLIAVQLVLAGVLTGALGLPLPAVADTPRGSVRGTVVDDAGKPAADASVRIVHEGTNASRTLTTGAAGDYAFALLEPGDYRLEVEQGQHKKHVQYFTLQVAQQLRLDLVLQLGALTETVEVRGTATDLQRDTPALSTVIDHRLVSDLPLDGRNFLELALLVPGAAPPAQGSAGSVRNTVTLNVNGAREDANGYLLDGAANVDPTLNNAGVRPAVDAIEEFEVQTGTFEAATGGFAGGQVNVVTRAGTNRLTGSVYDFFRNGALDARNAFAPASEPAPEYSRNQFGVAIGGPIRRDRTFFFADYEGTRSREGITRLSNVPTAAERIGDFSQSLFRKPVNPFTGQPFPGDAIPGFLQSPTGRSIAALYPLPNRSVPFQNFVSSPIRDDDADLVDVRVDHYLRAAGSSPRALTMTARLSVGDRRLFEPFSGPVFPTVPGFGTFVDQRGINFLASGAAVLTHSLLNDLRVGISRVDTDTRHENQGHSINHEVGLPELSSNARDFGLSFISVSGFSPLGDEYNNPQSSGITIVHLNDTVTWTRGGHLVKAGFDARIAHQEAFRDVQSRGFLQFSDLFPYTGNALADLLLGLPAFTGGARLDNPQRLQTSSYGLFVQDSWRVARDLTISAGLRYDYVSPPVDADDRATVYDPLTRSLVNVGTGDVPRSGFDSDRNDFGPRLGAAWSPFGSTRTVVRGGYGLVYSRASLAPFEGLYFSPPYYSLAFYFPLPGLPLTLNDPFPASFPVPTPPSALAFQRDLRTSYLHQFNVGMQREIGGSRSLEIVYAGSRGRNLLAGRDYNQPAPSPVIPNLRPDPRFSDILILESRARSRYDALQARLQQRSRFGLSLLAAYTFGKSEDDASSWFPSAGDPNFPQDSNNPGAEYGRSNFDVRHRLSVSFAYDLPVGRDAPPGSLASWLLADWQVSGIVTLQSGRPFTVALLQELDNSNTGRTNLGFGANDRPNIAGDGELSDHTAARWFDTGAFSLPTFGTFGNAGRNILDGPGYQNVNLALAKNARLGERLRLQLRAEAFNVFNRVNYNLPDNYFGSPTFGQILSAQAPRHIQFGAKLLF